MTWLRALAHGLSDLRVHPWRAALSGISLCIGVLAVVAIFTVGSVTAEVFIAAEEQQNGRLVTVSGRFQVSDADSAAVRAALAAAEQVTATGGAVALVAGASSESGVAYPAQLESGAALSRQQLHLVAGELGQVRRLPVLSGRWFDSEADMPVEVVVNQAGARQWGQVGTQLALLADPRRPPVHAQVVGVVADGDTDSNLYVSLPALLYARPDALRGGDLEVLLHHPYVDVGTLNRVAEQMAAVAGVELSDRVRRTDTVPFLLEQLESQQRAFLGVAALTLVISALGMLNIGLASVNERARELVIRRAVGATRSDLVALVLVSAAIVGILAAGLAIALAFVGVEWWVPRQLPPASALEAPGLPWTAAAWGAAAAIATTSAGSLLPAIVAARLDVANALRD